MSVRVLARRHRRRFGPGPGRAAQALLGSLRVAPLRRIQAALVALLLVALAYGLVAAQATQASYQLLQARGQNAQLSAQADQLRYRAAGLSAPAGVEAEAAALGMRRGGPIEYVPARGPAPDLTTPIGPPAPDRRPPGQRALAGLEGRLGDLAGSLGELG